MALTTTTIWEIESGGDDTNNGGCFDIGQTVGMFADGSAASATGVAPSFTSASYAFVSGDVSAKLYIASGTNWNPGWYHITSVSASAAIINGTIGQAALKPGASTGPIPSTAQGCATTASPTGATWTIDYSQQTAPAFTYLDLLSAGSGLTCSSVAHPFAKQQVGNCIVITAGTNFTAGRYVIASVAASVATVVGAANITTGVGANGVGSLGGALASPGGAGVHSIASQGYCIKTGTYTITSATQNIAAGCFKPTGGANGTFTWTEGYQAVRGDRGTRPTLILNTGVSTTKILDLSSATYQRAINLILDGHLETSSQGLLTGSFTYLELIKAQNCTNNGIDNTTANNTVVRCETTGCSTQPSFLNAGGLFYACEAHGNTITGFSGLDGKYNACLSYANSGASSDGFYSASTRSVSIDCVAYNNGRDGFRNDTGNPFAYINCVSSLNASSNFGSDNTAGFNPFLINCGVYATATGSAANFTAANFNASQIFGMVTATTDPFINASAGNFALNSAATGGALLKAHGYPTAFPTGTTSNYPDIGAATRQPRISPRYIMGVS